MARTVFVNPARRRSRKRRKASNPRRRRRNAMILAPNPRRRRYRRRRRNAGIAPFVRNPLIMSNPPHRRRRRKRNPLGHLDFKTILSKSMTYAGGAAISVGANALLLNRVDNVWARNGARLLAGVVGGAMLGGDLGASTAGAFFYPLVQELAAHVLGKTTVTGTEADMDVLAADLEDIMDELDSSDLSEDDDLGDDDDLSGDEDYLS